MPPKMDIEAKLYYRIDPVEAFRHLASALIAAMAIARVPQGLALGVLDTLMRPECAAIPMDETRRRLYRHRAAVVDQCDVPISAVAAQRALARAMRRIARLRNFLNSGAIVGMTVPISLGYVLQYLMPAGKLG